MRRLRRVESEIRITAPAKAVAELVERPRSSRMSTERAGGESGREAAKSRDGLA
jgi:hypothetical protein